MSHRSDPATARSGVDVWYIVHLGRATSVALGHQYRRLKRTITHAANECMPSATGHVDTHDWLLVALLMLIPCMVGMVACGIGQSWFRDQLFTTIEELRKVYWLVSSLFITDDLHHCAYVLLMSCIEHGQ